MLVALALRNSLPPVVQLDVLRLQRVEAPLPVLASGECMRNLHRQLAIDEAQFVRATAACPYLGMLLQDERQAGTNFLLCPAEYGFLLKNKPFNKLFYQFRQTHPEVGLDDFCLQAVIARQLKFTPGSPDPNSLLNMVRYGYMVSAQAYETFLLRQAEGRAVQVHCMDVDSVQYSSAGISKVVSAGARTHQADLYIDCSTDSVLLSGLDTKTKCLGNVIPTLRSEFGSLSSTTAKPYLELNYDGKSLSKVYSLRNSTVVETLQPGPGTPAGYQSRPWAANCIAMGHAALRLPTVCLDPLYQLQSDIARLIRFWPFEETLAANSNAYNRIAVPSMLQAVDVENLFFAHALQPVRSSANNRLRIDLFKEVGRLPSMEYQALDGNGFTALMHALKIREQGLEEDMGGMADWVDSELQKISSTFASIAAEAPSYEAVLRSLPAGN